MRTLALGYGAAAGASALAWLLGALGPLAAMAAAWLGGAVATLAVAATLAALDRRRDRDALAAADPKATLDTALKAWSRDMADDAATARVAPAADRV